jgi:hypothetical protein
VKTRLNVVKILRGIAFCLLVPGILTIENFVLCLLSVYALIAALYLNALIEEKTGNVKKTEISTAPLQLARALLVTSTLLIVPGMACVTHESVLQTYQPLFYNLVLASGAFGLTGFVLVLRSESRAKTSNFNKPIQREP